MARLLAAFVGVRLLPIAVLALLSIKEERFARQHEGPDAESVISQGHSEAEEGGQPGQGEAHGEMDELLGLPITSVELGVAGISLVLSILVALYVARTIVRPIKELESAMSKVEEGDLEVKAPVRSEDELGRLAASFNKMVDGVRKGAFIRDLFGQYVTPELAREAIEHEGKLDGQLVTCTILFSDIRNFTGVSEQLPASQLVEMLNRYFSRMADQIVEHGGLVNKYGGDSVLAMFGTPLNPTVDHAAQAVKASLSMRRALDELNAELEAGYLPKIMIGVGIATGDVVAGNLGSDKKLEYTVIGDAVNVASRLQNMTKETGRTILVNAETARAAPDAARYVEIGDIEVRGRTRRARVFSIEDPAATASGDEQQHTSDLPSADRPGPSVDI